MPPDFEARIKQGRAARYVELEGPEKDLYRGGAAHVLAVVDEDRIVELLYLHDIEDINSTINRALGDCRDWYHAYTSTYTLIEPEPLADGAVVARVVRLHGETTHEDSPPIEAERHTLLHPAEYLPAEPREWTPARIKALREALGDVAGQHLSQAEFGGLVGLDGKNVGRTARGWEHGRPPSAMALATFDRLTVAAPDLFEQEWLPEFLIGEGAIDVTTGEFHPTTSRLWYPRFVAVQLHMDELPVSSAFDLFGLAGGYVMAVRWLDPPSPPLSAETVLRLLARAAAVLEADMLDGDGALAD